MIIEFIKSVKGESVELTHRIDVDDNFIVGKVYIDKHDDIVVRQMTEQELNALRALMADISREKV